MLHEDLELLNKTANSFEEITSEGQTVVNVTHNNNPFLGVKKLINS